MGLLVVAGRGGSYHGSSRPLLVSLRLSSSGCHAQRPAMETDHRINGSTIALLARPATVECRNSTCPLWAAPVAARADHDRCLFCGWQLACVGAQDVAVQTGDGDWAVADQVEVVMRGREFAMKALAVRLTVRWLGHGAAHYSMPCVCDAGLPVAGFERGDFNAAGACRYCDGLGVISLAAARAWGRNPCVTLV